MDERKLRKLREVVAERLSSGEDPAVLRDQLARELPADQAEELVADARQRLEGLRRDPKFARSVKEIRRRRQADGASRPAAKPRKPGLRVTAGVFGGLAVLLLVSGLAASITRGRPDIAPFVSSLLLIIPSAVLWRSNSLVAAGVLVGVSGLGLLFSTIFAISSINWTGFAAFPVAALWLILTATAVRAVLEVRVARRIAAASPTIAAEVFD